jgi:hypothetical protein
MEYYQLNEHLVISPATLLVFFFSFFWNRAGGVPRLPSNQKPMFFQGVFRAFYGHIFSSFDYNQSTESMTN